MLTGYARRDGRKGIRNTVVVAYLVECAHHVAREIAWAFHDREVHVIGFQGELPVDDRRASHRYVEGRDVLASRLIRRSGVIPTMKS